MVSAERCAPLLCTAVYSARATSCGLGHLLTNNTGLQQLLIDARVTCLIHPCLHPLSFGVGRIISRSHSLSRVTLPIWMQRNFPAPSPAPVSAGTMFTGATKIVKPEGQEADEFEQTVAQELFNLEVRGYTNWASLLFWLENAKGDTDRVCFACCCGLGRTGLSHSQGQLG